MPSTVIDSALYGPLFGTPEMRDVFSERTTLQCYLDVEAALARVQARLGIIPHDAAARINRAADADLLDLPALADQTTIVGYPILPLVRELARHAEDGAGEFAHWGATTQDVMDTGLALQLRMALDLVARDLDRLADILTDLARHYRDTPMAGRTHLQHALPVTFGYKAGVWLSSVLRHRERLAQLRPRVLVGQFAGAAGTLASLGEDGLAVSDALMDELGLGRPSMPWHAARDTVAETVGFLGLVTSSLAKIATDVAFMMTTEVGEVAEPFQQDRGASSTMPQKRNPISCELILAQARLVRQHAAAALDAAVVDFERATGPWHVEWSVVPDAFVLTAGALGQANFMLGGLEVDTARMARNLEMTRGLIVAEAVMMGLAPALGRNRAHDVVYDACREALARDVPLVDVLAGMPEITERVARDELERLCDPANYLGAAPAMVDRLLAARA